MDFYDQNERIVSFPERITLLCSCIAVNISCELIKTSFEVNMCFDNFFQKITLPTRDIQFRICFRLIIS